MGYSTGEANILTRLRAMGDWDVNNSVREDWQILNTGSSAKYAILRQGEHGNNADLSSIGGITKFHNWQTVIEVWQKYDTPGTDPTALESLADSIIDELWKYPYLGGGQSSGHYINDIGGSEMQERWLSDGAKFAVLEVTIEWQEEKTITPAE